MKNKFKKNLKNNSGLVLVEYVLLIALVAIAVMASIGLFKDTLSKKFTDINTAISK
ncbi:MAG: hypothetical protein AAB693_00925 [Patescibacteria group bacterium]